MASRALVLLATALTACGPGAISVDEYNTLVVRLPDGFRVRCEMMTHPQDVARGMMFRESLAEDRGMLFFHGEPGRYSYWMYHVKMPLDIIWMDNNHRIVEMSPNTPPCEAEDSDECPNYGGTTDSTVVLELAGGSIEKHGLRVGQRLEF